MKRAIIAPIALVFLLAAPAAGPAQPLWFDLTVPGSIEEMLGTPNRSLEGPHLLRRLIDVFHDPTGTIANPEQAAGAFRDCLGDVQRLRDRWRAVEQAVGEVSLSAAAYADGRPALERFLELFGLRLTGGDDPRVAPNREDGRRREAEETADEERRAVCGVGDGWSSARIERRLNAGETIVWDVPHFEVSLPLSPRVWLQVLYGDDIAAGAAEQAAERAADLVGRLVTNSRAARFYAGLAALDDATFRAIFSGSPIKRLGRDRFVRNVLIAIGNCGDITVWPTAKRLLGDPSPLVRAMAVWASRRLAPPADFAKLRARHALAEKDPAVLAEWQGAKPASGASGCAHP